MSTALHQTHSDFVRLLRTRSEQEPSNLAFSFSREAARQEIGFSYQQLDRAARRLGAFLMDRALTGERALLLFQPSEDYLIALLGCWYAGVTAVPAYAPRQNASAERIHLIRENAQAISIISTSAILDGLEAHSFNTAIKIAIDSIPEDIEDQWRMPKIDADTLAVLQYTSGSTGEPKGVCLRHRHLMENSRIISNAMRSTRESVGVIWIPPYHDMGLIGGLLQPLHVGFPVHLMAPAVFLQRPMRWLEAISRHRGTISAAPNFAYDLCVKRARPDQIAQIDLSSWRVAANGAEPIRGSTLRNFERAFAPAGFNPRAFFPCFGMAETTLLVTGAEHFGGAMTLQVAREGLAAGALVPMDEGGVELVSSGRPAPGTLVEIVDPHSLQACAPGEIGEIWVSGATVADGYWRRPGATGESFGARLAGSEAAWLRTGDLGSLHGGELYVTGRIKDLIVIRGQNHYPQDIEATALAAHPALRPQGAAAFAVETVDGEALGLVLEMDRGWQPADLVAARIAVTDAIAREHQLQAAQIVFVKANSIPKTSSGKVQRLRTRERWLADELSVLDTTEVPA